MFCSKCGAQMQEGAKFCGSCGQPVGIQQQVNTDQSSAAIQPQHGAEFAQKETFSDKLNKAKLYVKELAAKIWKNPKLKWGLGVAVAVIVVAVIAIVAHVGYLNTGYEDVMDKYFTVLETGDADLYISILPDGWLEEVYRPKSALGAKVDVERELEKYIVDNSDSWTYLDYVHVDENTALRAVYGDNYKIDYKIYNVYNLTEEELFELASDLESNADGFILFEDVEKAVRVSVRANIAGNGKSDKINFYNPILIVKIKGEWKLIPEDNVGGCFPASEHL